METCLHPIHSVCLKGKTDKKCVLCSSAFNVVIPVFGQQNSE